MQRAALSLLLVAASCGSGEEAADEASAPRGEPVECAVDGSAAFAASCTVERSVGPDGLTLIVRHPGGGFRRLLVTSDGRGVVAADGAEEALVTPLSAGSIEVAIAGGRYRLPATVKQ